MIIAIITALIPFVTSSTFARGLHQLLSALGIGGKSETDLDLATSNIADAVKAGMGIYDAIENVRRDAQLDHAHAISAGSAAVALLAGDGIDLSHEGKAVSGVAPDVALQPLKAGA